MSSRNTANNLNDNAKKVAIGLLNLRLAEGIDLALSTKQAHWNLKSWAWALKSAILFG